VVLWWEVTRGWTEVAREVARGGQNDGGGYTLPRWWYAQYRIALIGVGGENEKR
jgi:hypothetical protein